jgi:hypothetical protein
MTFHVQSLADLVLQDVVFPGWWMNEGGQSSTGQVRFTYLPTVSLPDPAAQLIDFMINDHKAYPELKALAEEQKTDVHSGDHPPYLIVRRASLSYFALVLHDLLVKMQEDQGFSCFTELVKDMHMYPDLHGQLIPLIAAAL